jgi:hypothetical protein
MTETRTTLSGLTKKVFGELVNTLPEFALGQEAFPFKERAKIGKTYNELIVLRRPHGVTHQYTSKQTAYTLNASRPMQTLEAEIDGAEIVMRDRVAYGMLAAALESGSRAYEGALPLVISEIQASHRFYLELGIWYGNSPTGMGAIETVSGSGTTRTWTLSAEQWACGIWSQMEGAAIDVYDVTGATKRNSNAVVEVAGINPDLRQVLVSGNATDLTAIVATDFIVPVLAKGQQMTGLDAQLLNTGTLFGISAATYSTWKPNTYDCENTPLSLLTILAAMSKPVGRGLMAKQCKCFINEAVFTDLASDAAALRTFTENQRTEVEQGTHSLKFNASNNNRVELVSHPMIKQGDGFLVVPEHVTRGGESDITNGLPGKKGGDEFWFDLADAAGKEYREFSSQFVLHSKPSQAVKLYNIASRSDT